MVFKMYSTGTHKKMLNGKLIKDDNYKLRVNPFNKGLVYLNTNQKKGKKYYSYNINFPNQQAFMDNFIDSEHSLFKLNERFGKQTKKRKPYFKKKFDKKIHGLRQTLKKIKMKNKEKIKNLSRKIHKVKKDKIRFLKHK